MIVEVALVPVFGCVFGICMSWIKKHNKEIYELIRQDIIDEL